MNGEAKSTDALTYKYPSHPCDQCGMVTEVIGKLCRGCYEVRWWREALEKQGAILRALPCLELARDRRAQHVALIGYGELAFCRVKLSQAKRKRKLVKPDELPPDLCAACLVALKQAMKGEAK